MSPSSLRRIATTTFVLLAATCRPADEAPPAAEASPPASPSTPTVIQFDPPFDGEPIATKAADHGIRIEEIVAGDGDEAQTGALVRYHYTGYLTDGRKFHATRERGRRRPHQLTVGDERGLPGLHVALKGMRAGTKARVYLPADQAYGRNRYKIVQPHSPIVLALEVISVEPPLAAPQPASAYTGQPQWTQSRGDGVEVTEYREGTGAPAQDGDHVTFHYIGQLDDGTVFDSSHQGEPFKITMGAQGVMPGLRPGLDGAKVGSLRKLVLAPKQGLNGRLFKDVPKDATLTLLVEVARVRPSDG
ncbi:MAG: hypothetical protein B7733_21060 [Myxococcales bacterium FL481]|nr:MAG: hypothetical protein B7733_21060 [Myxococcales bacterium FL481]